MNETQTEYEYIDPALKVAGWGIIVGSRVFKQFPIDQGRLIGGGRRASPLKADYVLEYKKRRIGVIEAKARDKFYTEGVGQAKDYAERLNIRFTYSTNGLQIYQMDMDEAVEGDVATFPTPDELWEMCYPTPTLPEKIEIGNWKHRFDEVVSPLFKGKYPLRYYQRNATMKVVDAIANKTDRILLTMATGTGKTAVAFHICWKLFHAKWNLQRDASRVPRILFLADRNILANQAFNSFGDFPEDALVRISPADIRKKGKVPTNGSIFFTIFQTFMSGPNDSPYFGEYPKDFFDFIIIDECHRGGAKDESTWRAILEYFKPAVQLGLTATPKRDINGDTYKYFNEPVYTYSLKAGINDGFLTPFRVVEIDTTVDEYQYTSDDLVLEGEVEYDKKYSEEDFNRIIEIKEREEYRVKLFMDAINQDQKSIVFCATQVHAAAIRDLINQFSKSKSPKYCVRVTSDDGKLGEQYLGEFQDNEKKIPTILTTSQKLSTGVDAPEVRNIVLLRPINSMVEFKQIVGRGTRLYDGKDYFTIYDFVKAHHHFNDPEWDGEPLEPEPPKITGGPKPCKICGEYPCVCEKPEAEPCAECGNIPCVCDNSKRKMIRIKLADNKIREFDNKIKTSFWGPNGKPISAEEFLKQLFGDLPTFFKSIEELRDKWRLPVTRKALLDSLAEKGYTDDQLSDLSRLVHGENSDLFDVLSYVAYQTSMLTRKERVEQAKTVLEDLKSPQMDFINFVMTQYIKEGVSELDDSKISPLLILKYKSITDAKEKLGDIQSIRDAFIGFQGYLYKKFS